LPIGALAAGVAAAYVATTVLAILIAMPSAPSATDPAGDPAGAARFALVGGALAAIFIALAGGYRPRTLFSLHRQVGAALNGIASTAGTLALAAVAFGATPSLPGGMAPLAAAAVAGLALAVLRACVALALAHDPHRRFAPRTVLVGGGENGARLVHLLHHTRDRSLRLVGFVDDRSARLGAGTAMPRFLGPIASVVTLARQHAIDEVIIALPWSAEERMLPLLRELADLPVRVRLAPDLITYHFADYGMASVGGLRMIQLADRPVSDITSAVKRAQDLLLGGMCLALIALPMALIALAIRLDGPGPILFRQRRTGFNNRDFEILKFRTMHPEATDLRADGDAGPRQACRGDARITRVGAILRRTSLDELPQLFNVLRGEMSVVGPRPHAPGTRAAGRPFEQVIACYAARHRVRPGLTGLAQVRGLRGETDTEAKLVGRVESDLEYIENWSVWLDLLILFRTAIAILSMRNAY
jgi:Undecaprenyl-phosphate glucose phosphotransferase